MLQYITDIHSLITNIASFSHELLEYLIQMKATSTWPDWTFWQKDVRETVSSRFIDDTISTLGYLRDRVGVGVPRDFDLTLTFSFGKD